MTNMTTVEIIELVGSSPTSWEQAVQETVSESSKTVNNILGLDVINQTAVVKDGKIVQYRANVKLSFKVDLKRAM